MCTRQVRGGGEGVTGYTAGHIVHCLCLCSHLASNAQFHPISPPFLSLGMFPRTSPAETDPSLTSGHSVCGTQGYSHAHLPL